MSGVPGAGGPVPKRSDQRRRTNTPEGIQVTSAFGAAVVEVPEADPEWHPVAARWFESLAGSGQAQFYEPSDWGTAYLLAETMSRELKPQPVVVGKGEHAHVEMYEQPASGAAIGAWLRGMAALMVTEGDRRRARLELERPPAPSPNGEEVPADVARLADYRNRLGG